MPDRRRRRCSELGATMVEYALLIALIAFVCLLTLQFFGDSRDNSLSRSGSAISRNQ